MRQFLPVILILAGTCAAVRAEESGAVPPVVRATLAGDRGRRDLPAAAAGGQARPLGGWAE